MFCGLIKKEQRGADESRAVTKAVGETASRGVLHIRQSCSLIIALLLLLLLLLEK